MSESPYAELLELARSHGVQVNYVDMSGQTKLASSSSLLAVLRALGADLSDETQAAAALAERRLAIWRRRVEPVIVAWDGEAATVEVRVPSDLAPTGLACRLLSGSSGIREWAIPPAPDDEEDRVIIQGERFAALSVSLPEALPTGYHRLTITFDDHQTTESLVVAAPRRAYQGPGAGGKRHWGVFCPLYALHRARSWGAGDLSDLEALIDWTAGLGGGLVASLPMLASNFDGPSPIISPYSPTSRLFWNEFYLDLERIPELAHCSAARDLLASGDYGREVDSLRSGGMVDYGRQMRLKRAVLEHLAEWIFEDGNETDRMAAFKAYRKAHPEVDPFAAFQAAGERLGRDWRTWPASLSGPGGPSEQNVDRRAYRYHLYAQWLAHEQLHDLAEKTRERGLSWYLDFPIGVDFNSFDVWAHRHAFATGASVGCPPDPVFTRGQNWGFPPLHPDRQRESGYAYLIASIRNHLEHANALRIDHVMGLHRLFWIPEGAEAKDGAFVSTPAEEIYAILSVESHRRSAWLVGEDLGTVPPEVEKAMKRHNVRGMYVAQYELRPDEDRPLREAPESTVASINTHDMPPFAAFWGGLDLDDRHHLGLLDAERLDAEELVRSQQRRSLVKFLEAEGLLDSDADDTGSVLRAVLKWLAASPSSVLLINLEDLWLETEPQNTPNTYLERPNWRRKLRRSFEQFSRDPALIETLKQVDELRSNPARRTRIQRAV
jgi:4-alpha-glucanotransferase